MDQGSSLVQIRGIAKSYGGVQALRPLDLDIKAGEVHAICGENGAGKSTLNKILSGSVAPDSGSILFDGVPLALGSVVLAEAAGIVIVHQESAAFLELTATENHQLMHEPGSWWVDRREMRQRTVDSLAGVGEAFDPDLSLDQRSLAQRQMLAIARAVSRKCRALILDEPTASLSNRETEALFEVIRNLRSAGVASVYVSHRLEEIFQLADRVTVLRDGQFVETRMVSETSPSDLVQLMVGRAVEFERRVAAELGEVRLEVSRLSTQLVKDISFQVRAGEVVAIAGLVGAGRSEVARAVFGIDPCSGVVKVDGKPTKYGLALVPEDRQNEGLHLPLSVRENLMMPMSSGQTALIDRRLEKSQSEELIQSLSIRTASDLAPIDSLSGGNQQKALLGKWLANPPRVLILDEPTRGVDVGAKDQIHRLIASLADGGVAVLVISSELTEVVALADRVLVMRQGRIAGELDKSEADQARILELALPKETESHHVKPVSMGIKREYSVGGLLLATILAVTLVNPAFLSVENLRDMLVRVAPALIVGSMMTLVILAREIDISVGSLMGLCAATLGIAASSDRMGLAPGLAIAACLGMGLAAGLFNGLLIAYARIPSIIVTLGTLTLFRAATELMMGGKWIEKMPPLLRALGTDGVLGVPYIVLAAISFVLIAVWISRRTRFGLRIYALGSNPAAAKLQGLDERKVRLGVFGLIGLAAAVASLFSATQLQVVESGFGSGFELVVIASVIVGGTSIRGGRGSVWGTVLGASLLGIVATVLIFLRLGESATYWERAIQGAFILLAVLFDHIGRRRAK